MGSEYIQHNPPLGDGKEALITYFMEMTEIWPAKKVFFARTMAEDSFVERQCRQHWPGDKEYAGIDVFRLDGNGKIVEH